VTSRIILCSATPRSTVPLLVGDVVDELEPAIGNAHGEAEVEPAAAILHRGAEPRHAADVLGDRDGVRADRVDNLVGQGQVRDGVLVHRGAEVGVVRCECLAEAAVVVHHAGDAVEPEPVHPVLVQPETAVGQEEMNDLALAVVEAS
jgi:hypothetical protein